MISNSTSINSIGTKEGKQRDNFENFYNNQFITTESSLADQLIPSLELEGNCTISSKTTFQISTSGIRFTFGNCCPSVIRRFFHNGSMIVCCSLTFVTLVNLKLCECGFYSTKEEPAEKQAQPVR